MVMGHWEGLVGSESMVMEWRGGCVSKGICVGCVRGRIGFDEF